MATSDRYSVLTHIGPGTPMGRYMRFFWHPIAAVEELKDHPKPVRILGEDLVLFRTTNGKLGLVAQRCAHRSASLGCGMIEDDGIRCAYHAWKYDLTGQCVDIPSERGDRKVSSRIKIPGYQVH
jgi:5,5'-dehydrodivanillate O-demethylase